MGKESKRRRVESAIDSDKEKQQKDKPTTRDETYIQIPADGDCFYTGIVRAMNDDSLTVSKLRCMVADRLNEDHFSALQAAAMVSPREYKFMRRCRSLQQLKELQKVEGSVAGSRMCVWADWTQIQLLADALNIFILIKDAQQDFHMTVRPESCESVDSKSLAGFVHLIRIDACHYNLYECNNNSLFSWEMLKETDLLNLFSLKTEK
eukprot:m.2927 g.2927  ORF g.2927 m.2927 type:complete len:207 (+) comp2624_c0_seq1:118-738(+)